MEIVVGKNYTLSISGVIIFGPLEEKEAIYGAGFVFSCDIGAVIKACGSLLKVV